jgi:hypothetical protein
MIPKRVVGVYGLAWELDFRYTILSADFAQMALKNY